ncbi:MAG: hypothetical protein ACRDPZ_13285, partial [Gaiellaceae bacterium]
AVALAAGLTALLPAGATAVPPTTSPVNVLVLQSDGITGLAGVDINYTSENGSTLDFGTTDANGHVGVKLEDGQTYTFTASYNGTSDTEDEWVANGDNNVDFQTSAVTVTLSDHSGGPLAGGAAAFKSGAYTYWLNPAGASASTTDATGQVVGQLFDGTYDFRMQYNQGTEWSGDLPIAGATTVPFQTGLLSIVYSEDLSFGGPVGDYAWFTKAGTELLPGTMTFHPRGIGIPANTGCKPLSIDAPAAGTTATKTILAAQLADSTGAALSGGQARYQPTGGSINFLGPATDATGSACQVVNGALGNVTVTMGYWNTSSSPKTQDVATNSIFAFQTSAVTVTLSDHLGGPLVGGVVAFRSPTLTGSTNWLKPTGSSATDATGQVVGQLFDGTYDFRMQFNGGTQWTNGVVISGATTVPFQTGLLSFVYSNPLSFGGPLGDSAFFTKSGMELLPGSYNFHPRGIGYPANSGCRPIAIDSPAAGTAATKTIFAAQLADSEGDPLAGGVASYYVSSWQSMGTTDSTGSVCKVLDGAVGNVHVAMVYQGTRQQLPPQNVATNSVFSFQTTDVTVELRDHDGQLINTDDASVAYYAGGWQPAANTDDGVVHFEMLPGSYSFAMTYLGSREQKDSVAIGSSATTVTFRTGQVISDSNTATSYYAGGWKTFTSGMELLPGTWPFAFNDGFPQTNYAIAAGVVNHIH